uniref:Cytochrome P450 n=1 Tax=Clastoptera arizonana TaxID=38151 RepID=A0A1B6EHD4_9HEMI
MFTYLRQSLGNLDVLGIFVFCFILLLTEYQPSWWIQCKKAATVIRRKKKGPLTVYDIPGPMTFPIIGTRWIYSYGKYKMDKIHEAYRDMFCTYGKIVKEEALWNFPVINLLAREDIEKVLKYSSKYPLRPPTEVISHYRKSRPDRYTNLGLVNEQGEIWHNLRNSLTPELTSVATMQRFLPELNIVADDFNKLLLMSRDENGVIKHFEELANRMGLESSCTLILGRRLGFLDNTLDPKAEKLASAVQTQFRASRDTFYGLPIWKVFPTAAYKQLIQSEDSLYDIISEIVEKALEEEEATCATETVRSVFMSILHSPNLDIRDRKAGIIDFIAAGIKTLGNTLVFLMYLIAKNPRVQQKLYEEIIELTSQGTTITSEVLKGAIYLRACIMEVFRVLSTAPCVARIIETDMQLSGYNLKAGSVVLCHTWLASQEEENFTSAKEFIPERWLTNQCSCDTPNLQSKNCTEPCDTWCLKRESCVCALHNAKLRSFLVAPFGVGRRMCPGKRFVHMELQVVLAQTVRQFEIAYDGELGLQFEFLLAPEAPVNFIFKDRNIDC